jgi:hypothetical protein
MLQSPKNHQKQEEFLVIVKKLDGFMLKVSNESRLKLEVFQVSGMQI